ncbi:N-formylglutamate amidohydrolase [Enhygromyxa salina]|uniref:N-formylglutamate amidohydrolase n=1 Tax=Enhygromyxa salina TaxID=215803 RepID=A0A2S9YD10_9BACT|nr:N-formylglutamate amidohydrolase [Enhygromyxa salina]PRQ02985.1 N-formylglutamate amidohydrolase [Enhygromyxa salina]
MTASLPTCVADVVDVELIRGAAADPEAAPDLLVEVPHGADERRHYDALRGRLRGDLPDDLHLFFNLNTDVGAWAYGRATAQAVVAAAPTRSAVVLRSLVPRTFVDCNRPSDYEGGRLDEGALTPGIPSYVRDEGDRALLLELHRSYVDAARRAFAVVCEAGGLALVPHSYGPRSLGVEAIDDDIVTKLRWACAPERHDSWPLRAQLDLLTRDADGQLLAPPGVEARLLADFAAAGFTPTANETYNLHPSTLAHGWSTRYPGQVVCLEVRRDLVVEAWTPFEPMQVVASACERVAAVLAAALTDALR